MGFFSKLSDFFVGYEQIDDEFYDDLTDTLIMGDVGMATAEEMAEELKARVLKERVRDTDKAKELLAEGKNPIASIGADLGFATPQHFAAHFKLSTGMPPREWRQKQEQQFR